MTDPLQQLQARYRNSLRERQRVLEALWHTRTADADALAAMQHEAHRLAGSAPIYGYDVIGERARALDHAVGAVRGEPDGVQLDAAVAALLAALEAAASAAESDAGVDAQSTRQQVLLIDDRSLSLRRLSDALSGRGYGVRTAADETEVWQQLVTWPCTAVVIDFRLQATEPAQLIALIRNEPRFAGLPIVAVGAIPQQGGADDCDVVLAADSDDAAVYAAVLAAVR